MDDWDSDIVPQQFESPEHQRLAAFLQAAGEGDIPKLQHMLSSGLIKDINMQSPKKREAAVHWACRESQFDAMKFLVESGADVNLKEKRLKHSLLICCARGSVEGVKYLLEKKANINYVDTYGRSCLHWAAGNLHQEIVKILLEAGAPVTYSTSNNWQPLHEAVKGGDVEIVKMLVEQNAPINVSLVDGRLKPTKTPLHVAAQNGKAVCMKLLLEKKAIVNAVNQAKQTPLHEAAFKGEKECVHLLLKAGADPRARSSLERTPLLDACNQGHMNCALLLLDAGSQVNRTDRVGETALHHLLRHNQEKLSAEKLAAFTDALLQYGANPNLSGMEDDTPLMLANRMMESDVLDVILSALQKPKSLLHICKIACRRMIVMNHYETVQHLNIPKSLQKYLLINSSYFSGW